MNCIVCEKELTGQQRKFCSRKCKKIAECRKASGLAIDVIPKRSHSFFKDNIQNRINTKSDKIEYLGGYVDDNHNIYCYCKDCGNVFARSTKILRPSCSKTIKCPFCEKLLAKIKTNEHNAEIESNKKNKHEQIIQRRINAKRRICKNCGTEFISSKTNNTYCSYECRKKYENRISAFNKRIKRMTITRDSGITIERIIKRDGYKCWLCNRPVDENDYIIRPDGSFIAGDNYPSIDHVQALANGGQHTWNNVKLAHRRCNYLKRDELTMEMESGQLKLFC